MSELAKKIEHALDSSESNLITDVLNDCLQALSDEWISVDDDCPECDVSVLVFDGEEVDIDYCDIEVEFGTTYFANDPHNTYTHWKPLPQAPK